MFCKTWLAALCACVLCLAPASAMADFARSGPYVAVGAGFAISTQAEDALRALPDGFSTSSVGESADIGLRLGYRLSPHFATELDLEYVLGFKASRPDIPEIWDAKVFTATWNVRAYYTTGRVQPYALVGAGFLYGNRSSSSPLFSGDLARFAIRLGGGLEVYVTDNIFLDAGFAYVIPFSDPYDLDYMSIRGSVGYRF